MRSHGAAADRHEPEPDAGATGTPAGAAQVKLATCRRAFLLGRSRPRRRRRSTRRRSTRRRSTSSRSTTLPVNDTPVNDIGFDDLAATSPRSGTSRCVDPAPPPGRLGRGLSRPGTPLAGVSAPERHAARLYALPTRSIPRRARPGSRRSSSASSTSAHSPLGSLPASALVLANVQLSDMRSPQHLVRAVRHRLLPERDLADEHDHGDVGGAAGRAGQRDAGQRHAGQRDPGQRAPGQRRRRSTRCRSTTCRNETPVNDLPVNDTPVNDTRSTTLPVNDTPVNDLPINDIMRVDRRTRRSTTSRSTSSRRRTHRHLLRAEADRTAQVDCTTATRSGRRYAAGAIRPGITLGDLRAPTGRPRTRFDGITLGDLHFYDDVTLDRARRQPRARHDDARRLLPARAPLADRAAGARLGAAQPLRQRPARHLDRRQHGRLPRAVQRRRRTAARAACRARSTSRRRSASGFLYVPNSSKLVAAPGHCGAAGTPIADPTATTLTDGRRSSTWTVDTIVGTSYSLCFTARPGIELGPRPPRSTRRPGGGTTAAATAARVDRQRHVRAERHAPTARSRSSTTRSTSRT